MNSTYDANKPYAIRTWVAKLSVPGTSGEKKCFSAKGFLPQLIDFQKQISKMIADLEDKRDEDKIGLIFELTFDPKGSTKAELIKPTDDQDEEISASSAEPGTFRLSCYCNGGNG
jgi:hypothetical protein